MVVGTKGIWKRVLGEHAVELSALFVFSTLIGLAYGKLGWRWLSISTVPLTVVGGALGILLGFRSNEAYNRYNEARTLWGSIVNASRTLARQLLTLVSGEPADSVRTLQQEAVHLQIAFAHALRCQLWGRNASEEIGPLVPASELADLRTQRNVPDAILHLIAKRVQVAAVCDWLHTLHVGILQETLRDLSNAQGGCERIKSTPIPRSYTFVSHKIVLAYCMALPFGLADGLGVAMPLAALLISFVFLLLDRFANQIEDPFCTTYSGLPLFTITRTIEVNLRQRLGETTLPEDVKPVDNILP